MKRDTQLLILALALIATAAAAVARLDAHHHAEPLSGAAAPPLRLPDRKGGVVDLADLRGKVVLVNFWASWCPPCLEEMPALERLHQTLGGSGLVVLAVSVDEEDAAVAPVLRRYGITFTVLQDRDGAVAGAYGVSSFPQSLVIDRSGTVRWTYSGAVDWDQAAERERFRALLQR